MRNAQALLQENNLSFDDVVKVNVYLADMADFKEFNETYAEFFTKEFPARTCVAAAGLPKNAKCELEMLAFKV